MKVDRTVLENLVATASAAARQASHAYINQHGDNDSCGFAWVTVRPGNSQLANYLKAQGMARRAYGGGVQIWNPGQHQTQGITAKEEGARAWVKVMKAAGFEGVSTGSRMD